MVDRSLLAERGHHLAGINAFFFPLTLTLSPIFFEERGVKNLVLLK